MTTLILVHPFFPHADFQPQVYYDLFQDWTDKDSVRFEREDKGYRLNITTLIKEFDGKKYMLHEKRLEVLSNVPYVMTDDYSPEPVNGWYSLVRLVGKEVVIAGGMLQKVGEEYSGCAGNVFHTLRDWGVQAKFVRNCCFERYKNK